MIRTRMTKKRSFNNSMKTRLTPQQKKLYSYAKDGRNGRAESRSVANKAISKRKAKANRAFRRAQVQALTKDDEIVARVDRKSFKKSPDVPLAVYVQYSFVAACQDQGRNSFKGRTKGGQDERVCYGRASQGGSRTRRCLIGWLILKNDLCLSSYEIRYPRPCGHQSSSAFVCG